MRGRIPESTLIELRDRANILEVVSAQVGMKRVGRNHVGLCPFHAEKTPSFTVNEERGIFHCFGCGAGGNVFTFLMKMENLPFPEVVERLARRYGVTLPERGDDDPAARQREALYRLNDKTARFFQRFLWDAAEAEAGRTYLLGRGIGRETADRYLLGYAPAGGDALVRRLREAGGDPALGDRGRAAARSGRRAARRRRSLRSVPRPPHVPHHRLGRTGDRLRQPERPRHRERDGGSSQVPELAGDTSL